MAAKKARRRPTASGTDLISALPDGVRDHVLSFLPAHEAVRASLLVSRSWRDLWMKSPALHISAWGTIDEFTSFVYGLLEARLAAPAAPLLSCDFDLSDPCFEQRCEDDDVNEEVRWVQEALENSWIKDALKCNVQVLRAAFWGRPEWSFDDPWRFDLPVSKHLKELDLEFARLNEDSNHVVDFSGCPALLKLKMKDCTVNADQMRSPSLENLTMVHCYFREMECTLIRLPSLITLELTDCFGRKPLLEDFPSLTTAVVRLDHCCYDNFWTRIGHHGHDHHGECNCSFDLFFHALSNVRCMELSAPPDLFDFNRDIMPCPEFSKLKTLVLIDWFVADGLSALPWFLQHSPILERLTLEFQSEAQKSSEGTKRKCNVLEQSVASKHLKIVEIRCKEEGMLMVLQILKILKAFGVPLEKIDIRCSEKGYGCFSFACTGFSST